MLYNIRFYAHVRRYNAKLDDLLDTEVNVTAADDLQVVAATKLKMFDSDDDPDNYTQQ